MEKVLPTMCFHMLGAGVLLSKPLLETFAWARLLQL